MPGSDADPLLDVAGNGRAGSGGHSYKPSIAPFFDIGRKLDDVQDVDLFTVKSNVPDYWRIVALDQYSGDEGGQWTLSAEGDGSVKVGLPETARKDTLEQQFTIGQLGERWLPAAFRPVAIDLPDTLVVESSGTIVADADEVSGLEYTVRSDLPPLAGTQFSDAQQAATAVPPPPRLARFVALPDTPDIQQIKAIAQRVVDDAGATTPYAKAEALRDYFRDDNRFRYDTTVGSSDDAPAILAFLNSRAGFCVQFASAYAVMARSLDIPARVAVGFTPGERSGDTYRVTSHDAHAWPEIYLAGMGWTHLFDPTPSDQSNSSAGGSQLPNDSAVVAPTVPTVPPQTVETPPVGGGTTPDGGANPSTPATDPAPPTLAPVTASTSSSTGAWLPVLVVLALLVLLVCGYVGVVLGLKRRRRSRRHAAADPAVAVTGAWAEALDRLHEAAVVPRATQTPLDLAATVPTGTSPATARPMHELASAYGAARYGGGVVPDDARDAWESLDELEHALDDGLSWTRRWRRRLDASTLVRR